MEQVPQIGDRITDKSALPSEDLLRRWMGEDGYSYWSVLSAWIEEAYPNVFDPDWIYGGKKHGWSLRYKRSKAFCTLVPEYNLFSVVIVLGGAERQKVEARRDQLSSRIMALYDQAKTYHDGKWLKISVSSANELDDVKELLKLKQPSKVTA